MKQEPPFTYLLVPCGSFAPLREESKCGGLHLFHARGRWRGRSRVGAATSGPLSTRGSSGRRSECFRPSLVLRNSARCCSNTRSSGVCCQGHHRCRGAPSVHEDVRNTQSSNLCVHARIPRPARDVIHAVCTRTHCSCSNERARSIDTDADERAHCKPHGLDDGHNTRRFYFCRYEHRTWGRAGEEGRSRT